MNDLENVSLPIRSILPNLCKSLIEYPTAILVAPPGTGKTTFVPLKLLEAPWRQQNKIIVLEPRRVAARAAARRMAHLLQEQVGETVGYRTRLEKKISEKTIIEIVTEGLFLRQILRNPLLENTSCIIFDEIHERSLTSDLALSFCYDLQRTFRPDLRLIAMSATLSLESLKHLLQAPIIEMTDKAFPIDIHYQKRDLLHLKGLPERAAAQITEAWKNNTGNILVFLPGVSEIHRTQHLLSGIDASVFPLYGDMSSQEQDLALSAPPPHEKRRIVLATSIAETSLTVPGVRIVIDGGFRRLPRLDSNTGLTHLHTERISRSSAKQRAGRAGRDGPGTVYRLWTEATERSLPLYDRPEIMHAELSEFLLLCKMWQDIMGTPITDLPLLTFPNSGTLNAAQELLFFLEALDREGNITAFGKKMVELGTHPRLAAMMLRAETPEEKALAADIAALLEELDPFRKIEPIQCDIALRLEWLNQPMKPSHNPHLWHRIQQISRRYRSRLGLSPTQLAKGDPASLICAAFPDRLAQRRSDIGSFRLANGGSAYLPSHDPLAKQTLLAVASLYTKRRTDICLASPLEIKKLPKFIQHRIEKQYNTTLDPISGKVITREILRFNRLVLKDNHVPATAEQAVPILIHHIQNNWEKDLNWTKQARQLQARAYWAREKLNQLSISDLSDQNLSAEYQKWLAPWMEGMTRLADLKQLDIFSLLKTRLGYQNEKLLDSLLPAFLKNNGKFLFIDYTQHIPTISARAQFFYGIKKNPTLANDQIPLQFCLLSPAGRVQAITANLVLFWTQGWKDMRRDMKSKYPKHDWPENPGEYSHP